MMAPCSVKGVGELRPEFQALEVVTNCDHLPLLGSRRTEHEIGGEASFVARHLLMESISVALLRMLRELRVSIFLLAPPIISARPAKIHSRVVISQQIGCGVLQYLGPSSVFHGR
jgi:hypothetical protein